MQNNHRRFSKMPVSVLLAEDREVGRCELYESALRGHHIALLFVPRVPWNTVEHMYKEFGGMFRDIGPRFIEEGRSRTGSKIQFAIHCRFRKTIINPETREVEIKYDQKWVSIPSQAVDNIEDFLEASLPNLNEMIYKFMGRGSNWSLDSILAAEWVLVKYDRLAYYHGLGARGRNEAIPIALLNTKGIVDVDNHGASDCFKWAVLSVIHYDQVSSTS